MILVRRSLPACFLFLLSLPAAAAASAPTAVFGPSTWGTAVDGEQVMSGDGIWDEGGEPTTYARQWLRCDASGDSCGAIDGADEWDYITTVADIGSTLR